MNGRETVLLFQVEHVRKYFMGSTHSAAVEVIVAHLLFVFAFHVTGRRDYETKPPKLRLLAEIRAYPHRNDLNWKAEPEAPVDYCYVRPNHIPTINSMCHEFFWPGKIPSTLGFLRRKWFCSEKIFLGQIFLQLVSGSVLRKPLSDVIGMQLRWRHGFGVFVF